MHYHAKAPGGGFHATGRTEQEAARLLDHLCGMEPDGIVECSCEAGEESCFHEKDCRCEECAEQRRCAAEAKAEVLGREVAS